MRQQLLIGPATTADRAALWALLEPTVRAGDTFAVPQDMSEQEALTYWLAPGHAVFLAEVDGRSVGTYMLRANQGGGGDHVANAGYTTAPSMRGRGVARAMAKHSLAEARQRGFRAMQFNFVIASNESAVHLWQSLGFTTVGRLPGAFRHPHLGYVDALVMFRHL